MDFATPNQPTDLNRALVGQDNLRKGTFSNKGKIIDWTYRDTEIVKFATVSEYNFFKKRAGEAFSAASAVTKTDADANHFGDSIPEGQRQNVHIVMASIFIPTAIADSADALKVYKVLRNTVVTMEIVNGRKYIDLPLDELLGITLQEVVAEATANNSESGFVNVTNKGYKIKRSIVLSSDARFNIKVKYYGAAADVPAGMDESLLKIGLRGDLEYLNS